MMSLSDNKVIIKHYELLLKDFCKNIHEYHIPNINIGEIEYKYQKHSKQELIKRTATYKTNFFNIKAEGESLLASQHSTLENLLFCFRMNFVNFNNFIKELTNAEYFYVWRKFPEINHQLDESTQEDYYTCCIRIAVIPYSKRFVKFI